MYVVKPNLGGCADSAQDVRSKKLARTGAVPVGTRARDGNATQHFRAGLSSSAASRLGDGSGAPEMRSRLLWLRRPVGATPVPQARNVKARHGNAG